VRVFFGKTAPENLTGEIKRFGPTHLIIVDAIDAKRKPGSILRFSSSDIGGASFLTHRISARALIDYLTGSIKCEVSIIGIQPKSLEFGKPPCEAVRKSAKKISDAIRLAAADS
jgi:hydrogenase 3 maturation protease